MDVVIGPVLIRARGYAFDAWTQEDGLRRGFVYHRIEDTHYARKAEIGSPAKEPAGHVVARTTADEFSRAMAGPSGCAQQ